jgi:hypothetical protein
LGNPQAGIHHAVVQGSQHEATMSARRSVQANGVKRWVHFDLHHGRRAERMPNACRTHAERMQGAMNRLHGWKIGLCWAA